MAGMDREGGAFFANTRKQTPNQPDYRGDLQISHEVLDNLIAQRQAGVQFPKMELSGWKKVANSGTTFISLSAKKPYVKGEGGGQRPQQQGQWPQPGGSGGWTPPSNGSPLDDDIPFAPEVR